MSDIGNIENVLAAASEQAREMVSRRKKEEESYSKISVVVSSSGALAVARKLPAGTLIDLGLSSGPLTAKEGDFSLAPIGISQPTVVIHGSQIMKHYRALFEKERRHLKDLVLGMEDGTVVSVLDLLDEEASQPCP